MNVAESLQENVTEVLEFLWNVDTSTVFVTATDERIVILRGCVSTARAKRAVEAAARGVVGAAAVVSFLTVDKESRSTIGGARDCHRTDPHTRP